MINPQDIYKMFSRFSKREKAIFYASTAIVVIMLLDRIIILPIYSRMRELNEQISSGESGIVRDMKILSQKDRIQSEASKFNSYASPSAALLSEEEAMTVFLREIEAMAGKSSLSIIDMKPAGVKEDKFKNKNYLVNINCEGQMEQIMDFMFNIENAPSLLGIEKYQISPKTKESSIAQCSMTVSKIIMP